MGSATRFAGAAVLLVAACACLVHPPNAFGNDLASGRAALAAGDHAEALRLLLPLAQRGDAAAQTSVGEMYAKGQGVTKDLAAAERWLAESAAQGNETARMNLLSIAAAYRDGSDVPRQCTRAVGIMKRLFGMGYGPAFESLANLYVNGCAEIAPDPAEAFRVASESAERGDLAGQVALGYAYVSGIGVPRDYGDAMRWYRRAADRGSSQGQYDVGVMYLKGEGVQRDVAEAERWFAMSAAQDDGRGKRGLLQVATVYIAGVVVPRNCARAIGIVRSLADAGYAPASAYLGGIHLQGCDEVAANVPEGIRLTRSGAEAGDPNAQANLGWAYATGTGVAKDFGEAMRWSRKSADQRSPAGQRQVGMLYLFGQGVDRDPAEGKRWLELAAAQGDRHAIGLLQGLEVAGDPARRDAALRAAAARMSASELARTYLAVATVQRMLKLAEAGATIVLPDRRVTRENVALAEEEYRNREQVLAATIRERGFRNVAGRYRATPDPACERTQSAWTAGLSASDSREVEIRQDGFIATIAQLGPRRLGDALDVTAVVVESALAFADPMNSDYPILGVIEDGRITVRPEVDSVLRAWPAWAGPPSRDALAACSVTLAKIDGAPPPDAAAKPAGRNPEPPAGAVARGSEAAGPRAYDLATEYAGVRARQKVVAAFLSGEMVHYPPRPSATQEYEREKQTLDAREKELDAAIRARGFASLVGRYQAKAPPACGQVHSRWAAAVSSGEIREVEIRQEGYVATIQNRGPRGSAAMAVVVESTLVLPNPMGTNYPFRGSIVDGTIVLGPDVDPRITRSSSMMAGVPSGQALSECVVTLTRAP